MTLPEIAELAKSMGGRRRKDSLFGFKRKRWVYKPVARFSFRQEADQKRFMEALPLEHYAAHGPFDNFGCFWVYVWITPRKEKHEKDAANT